MRFTHALAAVLFPLALLAFAACDDADGTDDPAAGGPDGGGGVDASDARTPDLDGATPDASDAGDGVDAGDAGLDADAGPDVELAPLSRLTLGGGNNCLRSETGLLRCWGNNYIGGLGVLYDPDNEDVGNEPGDFPLPDAQFLPAGRTIVQASLGAGGADAFGCAVDDLGAVRCFGSGTYVFGSEDYVFLGDEPTDYPIAPLDLGGPARQVVCGADHACALLMDGTVRCWGSNNTGELGNGSLDPIFALPPPPVPTPPGVVRLYAGPGSTCALTRSGAVHCWGANTNGSFARGITSQVGGAPGEMPPPASAFGGPVKDLAVGFDHVCAVLVSGEVRCAGSNASFELGVLSLDGPLGDAPTEIPLAPANKGAAAVQVAVASGTTCVRSEGGAVACFGSNDGGRAASLADAVAGDRSSELPRPPIDLGEPALEIAGGANHFCALLANDRVRCWGPNGNAQLGNGTSVSVGDNETPASVAATAVFP